MSVITVTTADELILKDGSRAKLLKLVSGTDTTIAIIPGAGYGYPIGNYTAYTESSGTYTFTVVAGTATQIRYILFLAL